MFLNFWFDVFLKIFIFLHFTGAVNIFYYTICIILEIWKSGY